MEQIRKKWNYSFKYTLSWQFQFNLIQKMKKGVHCYVSLWSDSEHE